MAGLLLQESPAQAWIDTGHRVVALVAWADLTPTTRAKVMEILRQHPRYEKDLLDGLAAEAEDVDRDQFAFAMAATWPDVVKLQSNPMHAAYSHPAWHFIDNPYSPDGTRPATRPTSGPSPHNVIEALTQNVDDLKNPKLDAAKKAIAICWIVHLCGDIHQPLHAASLYSAQFPDGDQGGNSAFVLRDPPYPDSKMKLHLLWDELPGKYKTHEMCELIATGLRNDPRYSRQALADSLAVKDFAAWANESYELAVSVAYLNGKLLTATTRPDRASTRPDNATTRHDHPGTRPDYGGDGEFRGGEPPPPGVPKGYLARAERVAMRRVALAGYRLADLLNSIFDSN